MVLYCSVPGNQWRDTQQDYVGALCRLLYSASRGYKRKCSFKYPSLDCTRRYGGIFPLCSSFADFSIHWNRNTGCTYTHDCWFVSWVFRDRTESIGSQMPTLYNRIPILYYYLCSGSSHIIFLSWKNKLAYKLWF